MLGRHHQYPDGAVLFLGTMFAPVKDRGAKGEGFTHKIGDVTTISAPELGALANRMTLSTRGAALGVRHGGADEEPRAARPALRAIGMAKPLTGTLVALARPGGGGAADEPQAGRRGGAGDQARAARGRLRARTTTRIVQGQCTHFVWLNRGKESVVADLTKAEDRRLFEAILAKADVLVQNLKPGALAKLGFPIEELRKRYPRLICCSISGYGDEGPYRDRKAYDMLIQAESGLASVTGGPEAPARVGVSVVDICHRHERLRGDPGGADRARDAQARARTSACRCSTR